MLPSLNFIFLQTVLLWGEFICRSNESSWRPLCHPLGKYLCPHWGFHRFTLDIQRKKEREIPFPSMMPSGQKPTLEVTVDDKYTLANSVPAFVLFLYQLCSEAKWNKKEWLRRSEIAGLDTGHRYIKKIKGKLRYSWEESAWVSVEFSVRSR